MKCIPTYDGFTGMSPHPKSRKIRTITHLTTACLLAHFTLLFASNDSDGESRARRNERGDVRVPRGRGAGEGGRAPARFFFKLARTQTNNGRGSEQVEEFPSRASQECHRALSAEAEVAFCPGLARS